MKFNEIKNLSATEVKKAISKKQDELYEMKVKNNLGQLTNPLQIRFIKKDIARLKTAVSMKNQEVK
jgi:large subunit ribosomal protein L29